MQDLLNTNELYSNAADPVTAIATATGQIASTAGSIAQSKAAREAAKLEVERLAELNCGGRRRRIWGRKRKKRWDDCANAIYNKIVAEKQSEKAQTKESTDKLLNTKLNIFKENLSYKKTALWVGLGIVVLAIGGLIIYKKVKK